MSRGSRLGSESRVASAAIRTCRLVPGDCCCAGFSDTATALSRAESDAVEPPCRNGLGR